MQSSLNSIPDRNCGEKVWKLMMESIRALADSNHAPRSAPTAIGASTKDAKKQQEKKLLGRFDYL